MPYGNTSQEQTNTILCKYCGWLIHEEPYKDFTVWLDHQNGDGIFCGRRSKGLPHEPKD